MNALGDDVQVDEVLAEGKYPESVFTIEQLSGISDWVGGVWDLLTGKSQAWYDRLDADQKALAVRMAEVAAIGEAPWNAVRDAFFANTQGPDLDFLSFSDVTVGIDGLLKGLIVTKSHVPSDFEITNSESWNAQYGRYVDYVKSMLPELAAQVATDAASVKAALGQGKMGSPASVGRQAFVDELERRAKLLGAAVGGGILLYLVVAAALAAAFSGGHR